MGFFSDIYTQTMREATLPHSPGCPELEAMVLLRICQVEPGFRKSRLMYELAGRLNKDTSEYRFILRCIDCLTWLKYLAVYDYGYHITPLGLKRLEELKEQTHSAMMDLAMGY